MIMEWAEQAEPSLLSLGEDLPLAAAASKLSLDDLKKEVRVIEATGCVFFFCFGLFVLHVVFDRKSRSEK